MRGLELGRIHPTAIISESATLAANVTVGANAIIYDNVAVEEGTVIGPNSILGEPTSDYYGQANYVNPQLRIGPHGLIRSGAVIYAGTVIGAHVECGHRVTIREGATIGAHCRFGTLADIQGRCMVGDYARFHSNVHVGQGATVGNFVWIYPFSALLNDPQPPSNVLRGVVLEDFAVLATSVVIAAGVRIGRDSFVAARSFVTNDVPRETMVAGYPARQIGSTREMRSKTTGEPLYPWREHFERGMPWAGIGYAAWRSRHDARSNER